MYNVLIPGSCVGLCGGVSSDCYCDSGCASVGDCCGDYEVSCATRITSCQGRCGAASNLRRISARLGGDCHCDNYCHVVGDCCQDYYHLCITSLADTPTTITTTTLTTTTTTKEPQYDIYLFAELNLMISWR